MRKFLSVLVFLFSFALTSCHIVSIPPEPEKTTPITEIEIGKGELRDGLRTGIIFDEVFEYSFFTLYSGVREFTALGCQIELYRIIENERELLLETSSKVSYSFEKEIEYIFKLTNKYSFYNIPISFNVLDKLVLGDNELVFMPHDTKIISLETLNKGYYKYQLSNENISIDNVEREFIYFKSEEIKYLYLTNNSDSTLTINLNIDEPDIIDFGDSFIVNSNNQLMKIMNNENDRKFVKIVIESNELGRCAYFYDENCNVSHSQAIFKDGKIVYEFILLSGESIYVNFSHSDGSIIVNVYEGW